MPTITFLGEIQGGRILTEQPLAEFEGQKVSVTVIHPETTASAEAGEAKEPLPPEPLFGPEEPVILEDLGRIRMPPRHVTTFKARFLDIGRLPPRVYPSDEED